MKLAARLTDLHVCPMVIPGMPPIPHVGGPVTSPGSVNVYIGGLSAARVSDQCLCVPVGIPDPITMGSATVKINTLSAARMGDSTAHGGMIVSGCPTVMIGDSGAAGGGGAGAANTAEGPPAEPVSPLASGQALSAPQQQAQAHRRASATGAPFCEACQRKKEAEEAVLRQKPLRTPDLRPDLADKWFKLDGTLDWPAPAGYAAPPAPWALRKGTRIDRYSQAAGPADRGHFFSNPGTSYGQRALPYDPARMTYTVYEVLEDIPAEVGTAQGWFDQPGGAVQFTTQDSVQKLIASGKVRQVR